MSFDDLSNYKKFFDKIEKKLDNNPNNDTEDTVDIDIFGSSGFIDYAKNLDSETKSIFNLSVENLENLVFKNNKFALNTSNLSNQEEAFLDLINAFTNDENFIDVADLNNNGKIDTAELKGFLTVANKKDKNTDDVTLNDILTVSQSYIDSGRATKNSTKKSYRRTFSNRSYSSSYYRARSSSTRGYRSVGLANIQNLPAKTTSTSSYTPTTSTTSTTSTSSTSTTSNNTNTYTSNRATSTTIPSELVSRIDGNLGQGFCAKVEKMAIKYNCDPNDLLAIMYTESGLNPHIQGWNGATGLIQFLESTAKNMGYKTSDIKNMTGIQQLDVVDDFFERNIAWMKNKLPSRLDRGTLYSLVFLPAYAGQEVLCVKDDPETGKYYQYNTGLDVDKDGKITKTDLSRMLDKKYNELLKYYK